jgi:hypothetical protein
MWPVAVVRPGVQPNQLLAAVGAPEAGPELKLTTLRGKLVKIGAEVVWYAKDVSFQFAQLNVPRK